MKTKEEIQKLADSLGEANFRAMVAFSDDDHGTCAFDCVCINLQGWTYKEIKEVESICCVSLGDSMDCRLNGYRNVVSYLRGEGSTRMKILEATAKSLEAAGYDVQITKKYKL